MKVKLLKRLRKRAYLIRYGSFYKPVLKSSLFKESYSGGYFNTRKEAENALRTYIILSARLEYKRPMIKMY